MGNLFLFLLQLTATFFPWVSAKNSTISLLVFHLIIVQDAKDKLSYIDKITFIDFLIIYDHHIPLKFAGAQRERSRKQGKITLGDPSPEPCLENRVCQ